MELGELEEHSPSKTCVVVNTLGKRQMYGDVVKYVFGFYLYVGWVANLKEEFAVKSHEAIVRGC